MKQLILLLSLLTLFACDNSSSTSKPGDEGANAGDVYAQEVQLQLQNVVNKTSDMKSYFPEIDIQQLEVLSQRVKIYYRDRTFINGFETDAINDGRSYIAINKSRWTRILNADKKNVILLHEMLGILGLEKNSYSISSRLQPEYRFSRNGTFNCTEYQNGQPGKQCQMDLVYDYDQRSFVTRNKTCNYFYTENRIFFRTGNGVYDHDGCRADDVMYDLVQSCSATMKPGRLLWTRLTFQRNGSGFGFSTMEGLELACDTQDIQ